MTDTKTPKSTTVTAGILLIGDELLSGRTQDTNLATIATFLAPLGVQVSEARILSDDAETITSTVRTFSDRYDYVFTTGGIGPTHDDITADCIARAFDLGISEREDALAILRPLYEGRDFNAARRRMARIPDGASLIANPVSKAPGFQTRNVFTLAGVPRIMKGMLADIAHRIEGGDEVHQISVATTNVGEGDVAAGLSTIAGAHPDVSIGSYPWFKDGHRGINFVARGLDEGQLNVVRLEIEALIDSLVCVGRA